MHLLRFLSRGLSGRRDRGGPKLRVLDRDARGVALQQGEAPQQRGQVGGRDRGQHRSRLSLPINFVINDRR